MDEIPNLEPSEIEIISRTAPLILSKTNREKVDYCAAFLKANRRLLKLVNQMRESQGLDPLPGFGLLSE